MMRLLLYVSILFTGRDNYDKGNNAKLFETIQTTLAATEESLVDYSINAGAFNPYVLYQANSVGGSRPYYSNSQQPSQALSSSMSARFTNSETPTKYPYAGVLGQIPVYGNPISNSRPVVSSSLEFRPQTSAKPAGSFGSGATTPASGTQFGSGSGSTSYSNFLGTTSGAGYYGSTMRPTGSGTASGGLTGTVPVSAGTTNPTAGFSGEVTKPGLYFGTGNQVGGTSRPPVNTESATALGSGSLSQPSSTGNVGFTSGTGGYYQQPAVTGSYGSSGCPSHLSKPGVTCLQVGPLPGSGTAGNNNVQTSINSGLHPGNQITFLPSNGTIFGYEGYGTSVSILGSSGGGSTGNTGGSGVNSFIPQTISSTGTVGNQNGLGGSHENYQISSIPGAGTLGTNVSEFGGYGNPQITLSGSGGSGSSGINPLPGSQVTYVTPSLGMAGNGVMQTGFGISSGGSSALGNTGSFSGLQTVSQSKPASQPYRPANNTISDVQTVVCVVPELCSGLTSQHGATGSGQTLVPAGGVLCTPSGCRPVSETYSGGYYVSGSTNSPRSNLNTNKFEIDDTLPL